MTGCRRAAIATGVVDLVLPPAEIARELVRIGRHPLPATGQAAGVPAARGGDRRPPAPHFRHAAQRDRRRFHATTSCRPSAGGSTGAWCCTRSATLEQYVSFLQQNPAEVSALYQDILIHVTRFFRDPESFEMLIDEGLPATSTATSAATTSRSASGCRAAPPARKPTRSPSRLLEYLGDAARTTVPIQIFATDVSETAIEQRPRRASIPTASPPTSRPSGCGGSSAAIDGELPDQQGGARPVRLRPPGPDPRSAVLQARPDRLPQRADLPRPGAAEEADARSSTTR